MVSPAYFDDGTRLGSEQSEECRIDSIAQSWAVLSETADPEHAARAMAALDRHLIRRDDGLALLFTPPFDTTPRDPGYIKGYPPGLRENGGQYSHAAMWAILAFAKLGEGDRRSGLFSPANPINHASDPRRGRALQGRALCGRRRRLLRVPPYGPRGLDLVHGLGGVDVPRRRREHSWHSPRGCVSRRCSLYSLRLAWFRSRGNLASTHYDICIRNLPGAAAMWFKLTLTASLLVAQRVLCRFP